jgi:hypothetical protein
MLTKAEATDLINDVFEEEALVLGGLVALHDVEDDLVWRLVRNLDAIRGRALRSLDDSEFSEAEEAGPKRPDLRPHPAIEEFLLKIRSE